jgi:hypothetical protein
MGNTFATVQEIARQALPRLIQNLVFPNLCYRDFSNDFAQKGDTIQVRKPVVLQASEFDASQGIQPGDMVENTVAVKLDKIATVDVEATAIETAVNIDDLNRVFIEPAAVALAEKINSDGLGLHLGVMNTVDCSTKNLAALAAVRKAMNQAKIPTGGRVAVWDAEADAAFMTLDAIVHAEKSGSTQALREGSIGRVYGLDNYMAQGVKSVKTGITAATAVKVNGAVTAGAKQLAIDGTTLTGKLLAGEILYIGGKCYKVAEDTSAASTNAIATVKVTEPLPAIDDNTDVTLLKRDYTANLAFNPMAFAYVTRPLYNPDGEGVASYVTSYNGISLRVTKGYNQTYKKSVYSMDVLYGFKCIYPELAVLALG